MSTFFVTMIGLIIGGWVIACLFKIGAITLMSTLAGILLGVLYGVLQYPLGLSLSNEYVLFWLVSGLLALVCLLCALTRQQVSFMQKYF